jgi:hypothetical protein
MNLGDVWYQVLGGFYGPVTHTTLEEAEAAFEGIKDNAWTFNPMIVEHKVIKTKES